MIKQKYFLFIFLNFLLFKVSITSVNFNNRHLPSNETENEENTGDDDGNTNDNSTGTTGPSEETKSRCVVEGTAKNPKSYADCKDYNNPAQETICCLVSGTSRGTEGTSCLDVDILFENKTIEYNNNGVTGKLICSTESSGVFLKIGKVVSLLMLFNNSKTVN